MIEQEQIVQEKKDDTVDVAMKKTEEERIGKMYVVGYVMLFFILGFLFIFAPAYIQTDIWWIVLPAVIFCLLCWAVSIKYLHDAYPVLFKKSNIMLTFYIFGTFSLYYLSVPSDGEKVPYFYQIQMRAFSFVCLILVFLSLLDHFPRIIHSYMQSKDKIKAFFTAKHTIGLILSILAVGTALFQFIQVVLQIFHL